MRRPFLLLALIASLLLPACGGGSGSAGALPGTPSQAGSRQIVVGFTGNGFQSALRRTAAASGTTVTVTLSGKTVGTGQLDSSGKATIKMSDDIPNGSTLLITAGTVTATIVWNQTTEDAAVLVQVNADGSLTVTVASGDQPTANPSPDDPNESAANEDHDGNPTSIDDGDKNATLPANLPVGVSSTCTAIALTPRDSKIASLRFEENVQDGDGGSKLKFEGPFTAAMTFPLVAQSARIEIRLFDAGNAQLLDVKAPVGAFTAQPGQATPAPCPSPTLAPSPSPSP